MATSNFHNVNATHIFAVQLEDEWAYEDLVYNLESEFNVHNDYSDYEKGTSTTSDVVFGLYRQNIPWFAVYSYGGRRSQAGIVTFESEEKGNVMTKKAVEEKIEDLVRKSKASDVTAKDYNPKVAKLLDTITDAELTEKQLEDLKKAIQAKQASKNI